MCFGLLAGCGGDDATGAQPVDGGIDGTADSATEASPDGAGETGSDSGSPEGGAVCGNGIEEPGEACDDNGTEDGDGCSATCTDDVCTEDVGADVCGPGEQCPGSIVPAADTASCCSTACEPEATATVFVDNTLSVDTCDTYDVSTRACGAGQDTAYATLAGAAAVAQAGYAVYIRAGTFTEPLVVQHSGTPTAHVTFAGYGDEQVVITGASLEPAVEISGRQYVIIDGLTVDEVKRWLYARDTHFCVLRNNTFTRAIDAGGSSKTGIFFQDATHNRIVDNTIEDSTQDNLALHHCDRNLIARNTIRKAAHTLWAIKCGSHNIVRANHFENEDQKIGEIYDCDASGFDHEITMYEATQYNLVEDNTFALAVKYYSISGGNGIQNAGQHGIIRRNRFYRTNAGLGLQRYSDEANFDTHNRAYHNVFYANECGGAGLGQGSDDQFTDNVFRNNIFFENLGCDAVGEAQIIYRSLAGFSFDHNVIRASTPGAAVIQELGGNADTLAHFESSYPLLFANNFDTDPAFIDAANGNFHLDPASPAIDQGAFLTVAVGAGSGTQLTVLDAGYFFDGSGVDGELGDSIQIEGHDETARVTSIDRSTHTMTLDTPLTWGDGNGVSLAYEGLAPDLGAYEHPGGS